jgi:hypothetical protein
MPAPNLNRLRELVERSTPGPWINQGWDFEEQGNFIVGKQPAGVVGETLPQPTGEPNQAIADAAAIVALRNLAESILDCLDTLQDVIEQDLFAFDNCPDGPACQGCAVDAAEGKRRLTEAFAVLNSKLAEEGLE